MKMVLVMLVAAGLASGAPQDKGKKAADKFDGTWKVVSVERDGQAVDDAKDDTVTFTGDKIAIKSKNGDHAGTFKLDPAQKPKTIDMTPSDGPQKGQVHAGIYSLDGDTLKICFTEPGKDRPKELTAKAGSGQMLVVLKRAKP